jgi:hypothetical protein
LAVLISTRSDAALSAVWPLSPAMNGDWIPPFGERELPGEVVAHERAVNPRAASADRRLELVIAARFRASADGPAI